MTTSPDIAVEGQRAEWSTKIEQIRGSDLASRKLRLSRYLRGFSGAYAWTRCTPAGDLDALLAPSDQEKLIAIAVVEQWLKKISQVDLDEIVADGGITAGMVVQSEARHMASILTRARQIGDKA